MREWWERFSKRPWVAHLIRSIERFTVRGGTQLAASVAFYSVLSLVPILMLLFAGLGVALTVFYPEALRQIEETLRTLLPANLPLAESLYTVLDQALTNWAGITIIALAVIIWVSSGWVGNLKRAVRLLMRDDVDDPGDALPLPLDVLANFAGLLGLLVGIVATFAASLTATSVGTLVGEQIGLASNPVWSWLLRVLSLVVSFAAGVLLFRVLFAWFSPGPVRKELVWLGAGAGSAGLVVLQVATGYLISAFSRNLGTAVFGSTIVLMLFLNLFATLILFIATWLGTDEMPSPAPEPEPEVEPEPEPELVETRPGQHYVSARVAERSMGTGLKAGYLVGAATGLGLGALLVRGLRSVFGRRQ